MTDLRKAAEMLMKALDNGWVERGDNVAIALRQALAQPEQEPVAVIGNWGRVEWADGVFPQLGDKMYAAPPKREWVGLTDEEFKFIASKYLLNREAGLGYFQEEIEAKLKEKNT